MLVQMYATLKWTYQIQHVSININALLICTFNALLAVMI